MNLFILIKENLALITVFIATILGSLILLLITLRNRENLPKILSMTIMTVCSLLIIAGLYGLIFFLFF